MNMTLLRYTPILLLAAPASALADDAVPADTTRIELELGEPDPGPEMAPPAQAAPLPETAPAQPAPTVSIAFGQRQRPPHDGGDKQSESKDDPSSILHGFRLGYLFVTNHDKPIDPSDPDSSLERRYEVRSPHQFLIGYEVAHRVTGSGWLNILLVGNAMVAGLEQSKFFPSGNMLLGFEFDQSFQTGVGVNLVPVRDKPGHMIVAAGWTPKTGDLYLPLHFFFVPDVDNNHRIGATVGVNWGA